MNLKKIIVTPIYVVLIFSPMMITSFIYYFISMILAFLHAGFTCIANDDLNFKVEFEDILKDIAPYRIYLIMRG